MKTLRELAERIANRKWPSKVPAEAVQRDLVRAAKRRQAFEALRRAVDELEEFEGVIDRQTYEVHRAADFDTHDDTQFAIVIAAKDERRLSRVLRTLGAVIRDLEEDCPQASDKLTMEKG